MQTLIGIPPTEMLWDQQRAWGMAMVTVLSHGNVRLSLMDSQCRSGNQDGFPEDAHSNTARLTHHHNVLCSNSVGSVIF